MQTKLPLSLLLSVLALSACGGGGGGSSASTTPPPASAQSVVPAAWVGSWKELKTCNYSYAQSASAGSGIYYGGGYNSLVTIHADGSATDVEPVYNDSACTSLAGTVTTTVQFTNVQAQTASGYSSVATTDVVTTGSQLSASGGTGLSLASVPPSSGTYQGIYGINASGQWCSGRGANGASGYPTLGSATTPDSCGVKQ